MKTLTKNKGEVIFRQGDASDCMYDILWGEVGIYAGYGTDEEKLLTTLKTEQFFGEMGMIEGLPRSATAVALTRDTQVRMILPQDFQTYFQEKPTKVLLVMQNMSHRLRELTGDYLKVCQTVAKGAQAESAGEEIGPQLWTDLERFSHIYMASVDAGFHYHGGF